MTHRKPTAYEQLRKAAGSLTQEDIRNSNLEAMIVLSNGISGTAYFEPHESYVPDIDAGFYLSSIYIHEDAWTIRGSHLECMNTFHMQAN